MSYTLISLTGFSRADPDYQRCLAIRLKALSAACIIALFTNIGVAGLAWAEVGANEPKQPLSCAAAASDLNAAGQAAWTAGETARAEELLSCAIQQQSDNADILLFLGLAQAAQQKWKAAKTTLERGLEIAPEYTDIRIALARTYYWQQDYAQAERIIAPALKASRPHIEVLRLAGRIALARNLTSPAQDLLERALQQAPEDSDLWLSLGDAQAEAGKRQLARHSYRKAHQLDPDPETASQRLEGLKRRPWNIGIFASHSDLSDGRDSWVKGSLVIEYELSDASTLVVNTVGEDRGFAQDTTIIGRFDHQLNESFGGFVEAATSPDADFRADWELEGGLRFRLGVGTTTFLDETWAVVDARHQAFADKTVEILQPGLRQYLFNGRLSVEARYIGVWDSDGGYMDGIKGRTDLRLGDGLRFFVGGASAPETELDGSVSDAFSTVNTSSVFGGVSWELTERISLDASFASSDREDSYQRRTVAVGMQMQF